MDEYVDLGLSVKWATCNVGATKPEEFGDYFAWGEIKTKDSYLLENYRFCSKCESWVSAEFSKYTFKVEEARTRSRYWVKPIIVNPEVDEGVYDKIETLQLEDDAAHQNLGGVWRTPTVDEFLELRNECLWQWITLGGVEGFKVSGRKPGFEDRFIFLPAAGYRSSTAIQCLGSDGYYWTSTVNNKKSSTALYISFGINSVSLCASSRSYGLAVRPVCK